MDKRKSKRDDSDAEPSDDEDIDINRAGVDNEDDDVEEDEIWKVGLVLQSCQRVPIPADD